MIERGASFLGNGIVKKMKILIALFLGNPLNE
jgi:hypothetical protein